MNPFDPDQQPVPTRLFDLTESAHFAIGYTSPVTIPASGFKAFIRDPRLDNVLVDESDREFAEIRDILLQNADRCLVLAVSEFRRSLDLLNAGSAMWAQVTLYYSSFHAANALLGFFGVVVDPGWRFVGVSKGRPGSQQLVSLLWEAYRVKGRTHAAFWESYYSLFGPLVNQVGPELRNAIRPFNNQKRWQSESRNDVNYDSLLAFRLMEGFQQGFDPTRLPDSLPSSLQIQFGLTTTTVNLALLRFHTLGLDSGAANRLGQVEPLVQWLERVVGRAVPPYEASRALFVPADTQAPGPREIYTRSP